MIRLFMPLHCKFYSSRYALTWTEVAYIRAAFISAPIVLFSRLRFHLLSTPFFIFCAFRFPFNFSQWVYSFYFRYLSLILLKKSLQKSARTHRNQGWLYAWYSGLWHFGVTESCSIGHNFKAFFAYIWAFCIFQGVKYLWGVLKGEKIPSNNSKYFAIYLCSCRPHFLFKPFQ